MFNLKEESSTVLLRQEEVKMGNNGDEVQTQEQHLQKALTNPAFCQSHLFHHLHNHIILPFE